MLNTPINSEEGLEQTKIDYFKWDNYNKELLLRLFDNSSMADEYTRLDLGIGSLVRPSLGWKVKRLRERVQDRIAMFESVSERLDLIPDKTEITEEIEIPIMVRIQRILSRIHTVCRQLRHRYENRPTLDVKDEYDVQDLLHALLKLEVDDIRPEEWTPKYAGSASRMDFLLKKEQIVIEVKKTRDGLKTKQIGEQLLIDIARYREHHDCKTLVCFIYDPEGRIGNPKGLKDDLERLSKELRVLVYIYPK